MEAEKAEKKKLLNKLKREKEKLKKQEKMEKEKEINEKQRYLNLSDREKVRCNKSICEDLLMAFIATYIIYKHGLHSHVVYTESLGR